MPTQQPGAAAPKRRLRRFVPSHGSCHTHGSPQVVVHCSSVSFELQEQPDAPAASARMMATTRIVRPVW